MHKFQALLVSYGTSVSKTELKADDLFIKLRQFHESYCEQQFPLNLAFFSETHNNVSEVRNHV